MDLKKKTWANRPKDQSPKKFRHNIDFEKWTKMKDDELER